MYDKGAAIWRSAEPAAARGLCPPAPAPPWVLAPPGSAPPRSWVRNRHGIYLRISWNCWIFYVRWRFLSCFFLDKVIDSCVIVDVFFFFFDGFVVGKFRAPDARFRGRDSEWFLIKDFHL